MGFSKTIDDTFRKDLFMFTSSLTESEFKDRIGEKYSQLSGLGKQSFGFYLGREKWLDNFYKLLKDSVHDSSQYASFLKNIKDARRVYSHLIELAIPKIGLTGYDESIFSNILSNPEDARRLYVAWKSMGKLVKVVEKL
jgi:hypothetical protein